MSGPSGPAHARRPPAASRVAALVGAIVLILVLLLLLAYFLGNSRNSNSGAPGAKRPTAGAPGASRSASKSPSPPGPSERLETPPLIPTGTAGAGGSESGRPGEIGPGTTGIPTSAPTGTGTGSSGTGGPRQPTASTSGQAGASLSRQPEARPTPSGAPHTGGGSGPGVRSPFLLAAGILLLFAAGALLLLRVWPPDLRA